MKVDDPTLPSPAHRLNEFGVNLWVEFSSLGNHVSQFTFLDNNYTYLLYHFLCGHLSISYLVLSLTNPVTTYFLKSLTCDLPEMTVVSKPSNHTIDNCFYTCLLERTNRPKLLNFGLYPSWIEI